MLHNYMALPVSILAHRCALELTPQYSSPFRPTTSVDAVFLPYLVVKLEMRLRAVLKPDNYKDGSGVRKLPEY
jgi:hypothetical protein